MNIPPDLAKRLRALGFDPDNLPKWLAGESIELLETMCLHEELRLLDYRQRQPQLMEFERVARRKNPVPDSCVLSPKELAKQSIYRAQIEKAERFSQKRSEHVWFFSLPLLGVSEAINLWPGDLENSVILTPEEAAEFWERHPSKVKYIGRWWTGYWWGIEDPPESHRAIARSSDPPEFAVSVNVPENCAPWLIRSGTAGGETAELWSWNGTTAVFVKNLWHMSF